MYWFQLYELKNIAGGLGLTDQAVDEGLAEMVTGAVKAIIGGRLSPAEVMDLIPVQPLSEFEEAITGMSREKLTALYEKLKS
jgi:pyrroline-5-carboxylate reductase